MRFFKVTNEDECHHGFKYKDGLNIDILPFRTGGSCVPGGLYFTDAAHIESYYGYGVWVREVELPTEQPLFQIVKDPGTDPKWRASCIRLTEKVSLSDPAGCLALGVPVLSMDLASGRNSICVLEWWKQSGLKLKYSNLAIDLASSQGHVQILEFWKLSGLELKYTAEAIDLASMMGKFDVLEWWIKSGLQLKYTSNALDGAYFYKLDGVLDWWKHSGLEVIYTVGHLKFWKLFAPATMKRKRDLFQSVHNELLARVLTK